MAVTLGYTPNKATLLLSEGADWVCSLSEGGPWPAGTEVWCEVGGERWDADVSAEDGVAVFRVESAETDLIATRAAFRIYYSIPGSPSTEYLWFTGNVKRVD